MNNSDFQQFLLLKLLTVKNKCVFYKVFISHSSHPSMHWIVFSKTQVLNAIVTDVIFV